MSEFLQTVDDRAQAILLLMMGLGLVLASGFLWSGLITGDNWTAVCGVLFGSSSIGHGMTRFGRNGSR